MQPEGEGVMWKATDYGDAGYWDARYKTEKVGAPFDWYRSYAALRAFIRRFIPTSRVLMLGCGNSRTSPFSLLSLHFFFLFCCLVSYLGVCKSSSAIITEFVLVLRLTGIEF
jgi:hypothetical protein